jgi:peroxiredoxin
MASEDREPSAGPPKPRAGSNDSPTAARPPQASPESSAAPTADTATHAEKPAVGRPPLQPTPRQILALAVLALFTIFITWRTKSLEKAVLERTPASAMMSKDAPDFSLPSLGGETISLADYRGKKNVVVSYWASWCGPCKVELPELRDFYQRHHQEDTNFEILAISIDEERSDAEKYVATEKLPFPVLLDPHSKVADTYTVQAIPTTFVVDKSGKIIYARTGLAETMQFELIRTLGIRPSGLDDDDNREKKQ